MKNNKKYIFISFGICVLVMVLGTIYFIKRNSAPDENAVTRYEWIEMLTEQMGLQECTTETPYFTDVVSDNPYFACIQSAAEQDIIESGTAFDGEDFATGKFIALTAMKTIGESKFRICFGTDEVVTDDTYMEFALEHGLIDKEKLKKDFTREECEQVLETLKNLYFSEFWKDDYSNVVYQDGVIELSPEDVLRGNIDGSEITVTDDMINSCIAGNIVVFTQETTGLKLARKITGIDSDGTLTLGDVELNEIVETLTVSDITEVTFDDIVNYYGLDENINASNNLIFQQNDTNVIDTAVFSREINSKGYKLSVSTQGEDEERCIAIQITENATGISYTFPISDKVKRDDEYSVEIDIDKICIGAQIDYSLLGGLNYAEAAVDAHATFKSEIKAEEEKKILLFKTPVPLGNGIIGADIQIYLVLSVDGSISFEAELPLEASVSYEKNRGLRNIKNTFSVDDPMIEVDCNAGAGLRVEPVLMVLGCPNVMDMEFDIGVSAEAKVITRPNSQICADVSISFPVMTVSVCDDDDIDTIIGDLGIAAEWEIITSDDAPIKRGLHYELFPDKKAQFVKECTYKKQEETFSKDVQREAALSEETTEFVKYHNYELPIGLRVNGPLEDSGDYYTIKGRLIIYYGIGYEEFDHLDTGDNFQILDKQFIKGEGFQKEGFPELIYRVYSKDDGGEYYICTTVSKDSGRSNDRPYYYLYDFISDYDDSVRLMEEIHDDWNIDKLKIAKDALISSLTSPEQSYTAEECYTNNIILDGDYSITEYSLMGRDLSDEEYMFFNITFNENGIVDSMILYSSGVSPD